MFKCMILEKFFESIKWYNSIFKRLVRDYVVKTLDKCADKTWTGFTKINKYLAQV